MIKLRMRFCCEAGKPDARFSFAGRSESVECTCTCTLFIVMSIFKLLEKVPIDASFCFVYHLEQCVVPFGKLVVSFPDPVDP
jgi:hypothetical protein